MEHVPVLFKLAVHFHLRDAFLQELLGVVPKDAEFIHGVPIRELAFRDFFHDIFEFNWTEYLCFEQSQLACNELFLFLAVLFPLPIQGRTIDSVEHVML